MMGYMKDMNKLIQEYREKILKLYLEKGLCLERIYRGDDL